MLAFADIETDGLKPTKIHVMVVKLNSKVYKLYDKVDYFRWYNHYKKDISGWVFHNGLGFDVRVLNRLWDAKIDYTKVIDTLVCSKLFNYSKYNTHSLEELGTALGCPKSEYNGDWSVLTKEMEDYCVQDVEVLETIFNHYKPRIYDPNWRKSLRLEHDTAWLCADMTDTGFKFNIKKAEELLEEITKDMDELEASFRSEIGSVLKENKRLKVRYKKDGSLYDNVIKAIAEADKVEMEGDEYIIYKLEPFNPGSPKQRIDVLWQHDWEPTEMTKGHKEFLRKDKVWS